MKKTLLFLSAVLVVVTSNAQSVLNGDFENWITSTFETPMYYPFSENTRDFFANAPNYSVVKVSPGYNNSNYAVQITTIPSLTGDTNTGFFANINPDNNSPTNWTGGMAYNQMATGIRGWYKNNEVSTDSGLILVAFSKGGVNIGTYPLPLGGVHSNWTLFNFTFSPALTQTPDSVAFGATSSNPLASVQFGGSTLTIDSVSFTGVSSQPLTMNGDFELWQTANIMKPAYWNYDGDQNGDGMQRTNDHYAGNYAVELTTYAKNSDKGNGLQANAAGIGTGYYPNCPGQGNCTELGGYPFTNQVDTLEFYYKYVPMGNDSAVVEVNFKKNGVQDGGSGIKLGAAGSYQYAMLPVYANYPPDTVTVDIQSSNNTDTSLALVYVGSDLKIDNIHFKSQPVNVGIPVLQMPDNVVLYPNPSKDKVTIEVSSLVTLQDMQVRIYDIIGKELMNVSMNDHKTTIAKGELYPGMYFYDIINNNQVMKQGKLVFE